MVQTGMTTPYTAFAQQNGGPAGDTSVIKAADMKGVDGGGPGGGGGSPPNAAQQALQALHQSAQHANGVVDQQNATVSKNYSALSNCSVGANKRVGGKICKFK